MTELFPLKPVNLLVARNATGKTRTIRAFLNVTSFLQMKKSFMDIRSFEAALKFTSSEDAEWKMDYKFKINNGIVEKEVLVVNEKVLINRSKTSAKYDTTKINPPSEKLVVQIRRDKELYPEIEQLMTWADGVTSLSYSDITPFTILGPGKFHNPYNFSDLVESLSQAEKQEVLSVAKRLGYNIAQIKTVEATKGIKLM